VEILVCIGWNLKQVIFGEKEWEVPRLPQRRIKENLEERLLVFL
jgi:hypothetical protein